MVHDRAEPGPPVTVAGDPRVTAFGRYLRRAKLDELPQLWNVIKGDMSLVGPRPDVPGYADRLTGPAAALLELRPGVTGPATLYLRDEERLLAAAPDPQTYNDAVLYPLKVRMDLAYLADWTLVRDLGYLAVTAVPGLDRILRVIPAGTDVPDPSAPIDEGLTVLRLDRRENRQRDPGAGSRHDPQIGDGTRLR
jgi:lipopolysaccharide/colanic/teichoic acid biosynthesis glycosyltransferase